MYRKFILVLTLMISPAAFADTKLDAAINAYLDEDFSQMRVIEDYAKRGDVDAQAVIGQALWYGLGVKKDRPAGLSYLKSAASQGDLVSAVQLGRIYKLGHSEVPKDLAEAAKWFVAAAKAGETITAPRELKSLPRDIVVAAGGAEWAAPDEAETAKAAETPPPVISTFRFPESEARAMSAPKPTERDDAPASPPSENVSNSGETTPEITDPRQQQSLDIVSAIFGSDYAKIAPPYVLRDGSSFTILTDTSLSTTGDLGATCYIALNEKMEVDAGRLEEITAELKAGNRSRAGEVTSLSASLETQLVYVNMARGLMMDADKNGGFTEKQARRFYGEHRVARHDSPNAPTAQDCQSRMTSVVADIALSEAKGRYWNR